jgi:VanZ family protein
MSIKHAMQACSVAALVVLAFVALGPAKMVPRSGLGWEMDHFISYFAFTWMFCLAWPRPFLVGATLTALAVLLEGLQAFTPDRTPDLLSAFISAGGVLSVVMNADLFIRAPRRLNDRMLVIILQRFRLRWPARNNARTGQLTASRRAPVPEMV